MKPQTQKKKEKRIATEEPPLKANITETRLFKYIEIFTSKNENFQIKTLIFFVFMLKT